MFLHGMADRVCKACAKFTRVDALDDEDTGPSRWYHYADVRTLLESTESCPLCRFLVQLVGEEDISRMRDHAARGSRTRIIMTARQDSRDQLVNFSSEWVCEIWSKYGYVCAEPFLLCTSRGHMLNRSYWRSADPITFRMRVPTILQWIQRCEKTHFECTIPDAQRPTFHLPQRFLEVKGSANAPSVRLVDATKEGLNHSIKYIALSHCWGKAGVSLKTTNARLAGFLKAIPWDEFPRTFQDVITIARELAISYVWIDSLCIIQDDLADWQQEAAKMAAIFHHSYLTISAAAQDGDGGCGLDKVDLPALHFPLSVTRKAGGAKEPSNNREQQVPEIAIRVSSNYQSWYSSYDFTNWPLNHRGWIFQEILLSRRLLHIDPAGNIFWQCHTILESEDGLLRRMKSQDGSESTPTNMSLVESSLDGFLDIARYGADGISLWWRWLGDFFRREFTVPQDDLPALFGTMTLYQHLTGDTPVIGLWWRKLHLHMGWRVVSQERCEQRNWSYPSWSWASFTQKSRRQLEPPTAVHLQSIIWEVKISSATIQWEAAPYMSPLREAVLSIPVYQLTDAWKERVTTISTDWDSEEDKRMYEGILGPDFVGWNPEWRDYRLVLYQEREMLRKKWFLGQKFLPLWIYRGDGSRENEVKFNVQALVIKKEGHSGRYRRLGRACLYFRLETRKNSGAALDEFLSEFKSTYTIELA